MRLTRQKERPGTVPVVGSRGRPRRTARRAWLAVGLLGLASTAPCPAHAAQDRPVSADAGGAYRIFSRQLGLENDAGLSLRLGLGVTERLTIALDYALSVPLRKETGQSASVSALRALARYVVWRGPVSPYVIAGGGGFLVNFQDSNDYSTGEITVGAGAERALGGRAFLRLEASADLYRSEVVRYDLGGNVLSRAPRTTNALGSLGVALGTRF